MMEAFAAFDFFALLVLFISGVMALMRGFVREALTITAFVAAALATLWTRPVFAGLLYGPMGSPLLANLTAMTGVFLLVYFAVSFITRSLQSGVKTGEDVTVIDRSLGFVFGLARGLVLLGLLVLVIKNVMPGASWMTGARVYPLADATSRLLQSLAPEGSWAGGGDLQRRDVDDDPIRRLIERSNRDDDG